MHQRRAYSKEEAARLRHTANSRETKSNLGKIVAVSDIGGLYVRVTLLLDVAIMQQDNLQQKPFNTRVSVAAG